jgi:hypothetical protein
MPLVFDQQPNESNKAFTLETSLAFWNWPPNSVASPPAWLPHRTELTGEDGGPIRVELEAALKKIYGPPHPQPTPADVIDIQATQLPGRDAFHRVPIIPPRIRSRPCAQRPQSLFLA